MALAAQRRIKSMNPGLEVGIEEPIAANAVIFKAAIVAANASGFLVPAAGTAGLRVRGLANTGSDEKIDATGFGNGVKSCEVVRGIWPLLNSTATDEITQADVGKPCYAISDEKVALTSGGVGRPVAGEILRVDADGTVWVAIGILGGTIATPAQYLLTAMETVAAPGAISVATRTTKLAVDGTDAYTLAAGLFVGQRKTLVCVSGANTPIGTVTPSVTTGFATITAFGVAGDVAEIEWNGTYWEVVTSSGVTIT